jgi:hypothetical protein
MCNNTAKFWKSLYRSSDLDAIYGSSIWPDLKGRRSQEFFNKTEIARIKAVDEYVRGVKYNESMDEMSANTFALLTFALPIEKPIAAAVKFGGKLLGIGADVLTKAPIGTASHTAQLLAVKGSLMTVRASERIAIFSFNSLIKFKVNISKMFLQSRLPSNNETTQRYIIGKIMDSMGFMYNDPAILSALSKGEFIKDSSTLSSELARLMTNSEVVTARVMNKVVSDTSSCTKDPYLCSVGGIARVYSRGGGRTLYNELAINYPGNILGRMEISNVTIHETSHHLSAWALTGEKANFPGMVRPGAIYFPTYVEEAAVESTTRFLAKSYGLPSGTAKSYEVYSRWFDELVLAMDRGISKGKIKYNGTGRQLSMDYLYGYGLDKLDRVLVPGLSRGTNVSSVLISSCDFFYQKSPQAAIDLARSLYR